MPSTITGQSVWFITGCSTGFGRELAKQLLARGNRVVVTARSPKALTEFAGMENALVQRLDVTDAAQIATAVQAAEARFGHIDVLVNNAGIGYFAAVEEGEDNEIRRMFDINLFGLAAVTRAVLPGMRERRQGFIVNFSSIGGLRSFPAIGWYNATKFAIEGLSEALWQEVEPLGIRVMLVGRAASAPTGPDSRPTKAKFRSPTMRQRRVPDGPGSGRSRVTRQAIHRARSRQSSRPWRTQTRRITCCSVTTPTRVPCPSLPN
jgi:NADP-dependent 3-hydroxy acid dehydrogenase YdfG